MSSAMLRLVVPRIPDMLKTTIMHSMNLSPDTSKWDLRTTLIITTLRGIMGTSTAPISKTQAMSAKDQPVKGPLWVAKVTHPAPLEDDARQLLFKAIDDMNETGRETYTKPASIPVQGEWTGHRAGADNDAPEPAELSEAQKYERLGGEAKSPTVILYFHGGAYYMCDPVSHRVMVTKLCRRTGGKAFSVRYRLAPQGPFPAALLDCFHAYLAMLYPPAGALHAAVDASNLVFAGDSAGGNMAMVMLQLLLQLRRSGVETVRWNGADVPIPLPAGVATNAPWLDVTRSMPSITLNSKYDYLPVPVTATSLELEASEEHRHKGRMYKLKGPQHAACEIWPATPARADLFCDGEMLAHPLVSPAILPASAWEGSPPLFFAAGEEELADEIRVVAQAAHASGVPVRFIAFEAMPHMFAMLIQGIPQSERCFDEWGAAIKEMGEGRGSTLAPAATWVPAAARAGDEDLDLAKLHQYTDEQVRRYIVRERERRVTEFDDAQTARQANL